MEKTCREFTDAFKREVVILLRDGGRPLTQAASEPGLAPLVRRHADRPRSRHASPKGRSQAPRRPGRPPRGGSTAAPTSPALNMARRGCDWPVRTSMTASAGSAARKRRNAPSRLTPTAWCSSTPWTGTRAATAGAPRPAAGPGRASVDQPVSARLHRSRPGAPFMGAAPPPALSRLPADRFGADQAPRGSRGGAPAAGVRSHVPVRSVVGA